MANPYISFYKSDPSDEGSPFAGDTDGIAVSENEAVQFSLNAKQNETKTEQLAIRTTEGYIATNVTISFVGDDDNRFSISKTADGNFTDSITFATVSSGNSVFFIKASSADTEQRQADNSVYLHCEYDGLIQNDTSTDLLESQNQYSQFRVVHLPFSKSATLDKCGNTWTAYGSPTIANGALQLDGASHLQMDGEITLGGQDFTFCGFVNVDLNSPANSLIFMTKNNIGYGLINLEKHARLIEYLNFWLNGYADVDRDLGNNYRSTYVSIGKRVYFELDYSYTAKTMTLFIDGKQAAQSQNCARFNRMTYSISIGAYESGSRALIGSIENFMIYDGVALHSEGFTPPLPTTTYTHLTRLVSNSTQESTTIVQNNLTAWLPFDSSPTEDLCGNPWALTCDTGIELDPDLKLPAFRMKADAEPKTGEVILYCQGMYLGGKDFLIEFDLWYGGNISFGETYFFYASKEEPAGNDVIKINIREQFNDGYQQINLYAFGQETSRVSYPTDQMWGHIKLIYSHTRSKLTLLGTNKNKEEVTFGELDITIPRTFFTNVEIGASYSHGAHDSGYIRNYKIYGGETAPNCGTTIQLCVLHNGEVLTIPLRCYEVVGMLALAVMYDGRVWYNILRSPNDTLASDIHCLYNGVEYAFSI